MTDLGRPEVLLGLNINYGSEGLIALYAETYISKIAPRFNFEHCQNKKSYSTPMEPGLHLSIADEAKDEREIGDFPYICPWLQVCCISQSQSDRTSASQQGALSVHGKAWDSHGQSSY